MPIVAVLIIAERRALESKARPMITVYSRFHYLCNIYVYIYIYVCPSVQHIAQGCMHIAQVFCSASCTSQAHYLLSYGTLAVSLLLYSIDSVNSFHCYRAIRQVWRTAPAKVKSVLTRRVAYVAHVQLAPTRKRRASEIAEQREVRLTADWLWRKRSRASETRDQRDERLAADRLKHKRCKACATKDQREERLAADRLRKQRSRAEETLQQRATRLTCLRLTQAQRLAAETEKQRAARLQQLTSSQAHRLAAETEKTKGSKQ